MTRPKAIVLHAAGTNRDHDAAVALGLAGADAEIVHVNQLRSGDRRLADYALLVIPGGFSYADALGAGKLFALDLSSYFADQVRDFVAARKPVIGICNGFQTLVKAGILPGAGRRATLARNGLGRFECRWTTMAAPPSRCVWTAGLDGLLSCPIAHGEGRFVLEGDEDGSGMRALAEAGQLALVYAASGDSVYGSSVPAAAFAPAGGSYPDNPNGSVADAAGVCDEGGTVLGLMPHPEDNVTERGRSGEAAKRATAACLALWKNGVDYARRS